MPGPPPQRVQSGAGAGSVGLDRRGRRAGPGPGGAGGERRGRGLEVPGARGGATGRGADDAQAALRCIGASGSSWEGGRR